MKEPTLSPASMTHEDDVEKESLVNSSIRLCKVQLQRWRGCLPLPSEGSSDSTAEKASSEHQQPFPSNCDVSEPNPPVMEVESQLVNGISSLTSSCKTEFVEFGLPLVIEDSSGDVTNGEELLLSELAQESIDLSLDKEAPEFGELESVDTSEEAGTVSEDSQCVSPLAEELEDFPAQTNEDSTLRPDHLIKPCFIRLDTQDISRYMAGRKRKCTQAAAASDSPPNKKRGVPETTGYRTRNVTARIEYQEKVQIAAKKAAKAKKNNFHARNAVAKAKAKARGNKVHINNKINNKINGRLKSSPILVVKKRGRPRKNSESPNNVLLKNKKFISTKGKRTANNFTASTSHQKFKVGRKSRLNSFDSGFKIKKEFPNGSVQVKNEKLKALAEKFFSQNQICEFCNKRIKDLHSYRRHCAALHGTEAFCKRCSTIFKSEKSLASHLKKCTFKHRERDKGTGIGKVLAKVSNNIDSQDNEFLKFAVLEDDETCPYCKLKLATKQSLKRHLLVLHASHPFCKYCWAFFPYLSMLKNHWLVCKRKQRKDTRAIERSQLSPSPVKPELSPVRKDFPGLPPVFNGHFRSLENMSPPLLQPAPQQPYLYPQNSEFFTTPEKKIVLPGGEHLVVAEVVEVPTENVRILDSVEAPELDDPNVSTCSAQVITCESLLEISHHSDSILELSHHSFMDGSEYSYHSTTEFTVHEECATWHDACEDPASLDNSLDERLQLKSPKSVVPLQTTNVDGIPQYAEVCSDWIYPNL